MGFSQRANHFGAFVARWSQIVNRLFAFLARTDYGSTAPMTLGPGAVAPPWPYNQRTQPNYIEPSAANDWWPAGPQRWRGKFIYRPWPAKWLGNMRFLAELGHHAVDAALL